MRWSRSFRLVAPDLWVEVRLTHIDGRWLRRPTRRMGRVWDSATSTEALEQSLAYFE
jgi:hypothetical protein